MSSQMWYAAQNRRTNGEFEDLGEIRDSEWGNGNTGNSPPWQVRERLLILPFEFIFVTYNKKPYMRIAILSDIHANLAALECAISHIDSAGVDRIYCLGDTVGYGPYPNECVELIRERCYATVAGNHDWGAVKKMQLRYFNRLGRKTLRWTRKRLTEENRIFLESLPLTVVDDGITFVHASPMVPERWTYIVSERESAEAFKALCTRVCIIGHTHIPTCISEDGTAQCLQEGIRYIINVGSVGQPRDGNPKTSFGIIDTAHWRYELVRLAYNIQHTCDGIDNFGLPKMLGRRLQDGF